MSKFIHELPEAEELFRTVAGEMGLDPIVVEKDYWIMHCLWGLCQQQFSFEMKGGTSLSKGWCCIERFSEDIDVRFDPPAGLNVSSEKDRHVEARFRFYDALAQKISIPGIEVKRDVAFDDTKARNAGISLDYPSCFSPIDGLRSGVLLEVGFDTTAPNEPKDFTSWAYQRAAKTSLDVIDNRALAIKCFSPEYTFVDKLQTISKRYRLFKERNDAPRKFLRHYYDLYMLLELDRVMGFIGSTEYNTYKDMKLKTKDLETFKSRAPFHIDDPVIYQLFEKEYQAVKALFWFQPGPKFKDVIGRIRSHSAHF